MMRIDFDTMRRALRKPLVRGVGVAAGVVVAGAAGLLARESRSGEVDMPPKAACCTSALAIGDAMINPSQGGDKDFFEVPSSPPSAMFLLGNNESMQDYPQDLPEVATPGWYAANKVPAVPVTPKGDHGSEGSAGLAMDTGCEDPALVSAMSWFDKSSTEPEKNGSIVYDSDGAMPSPFFDPNRFYFSRGRRLSWNVKEGPWTINGNDFNGPMNSYGDTLTACYASVGWDTTDYPYGSIDSPIMTECRACLASKGWWRGPIVTPKTQATNPGQAGPVKELDEPPLRPEAFRKWVLSGRVLNVRPPKFVVARKVLKDVIRIAPNVRMGVATFGEDHGWFDPALILEPLRPSCDDSFPEIKDSVSSTGLNRPLLTNAVNKVVFRNNERSIGEALFALGGYFSSQKSDNKWENWFKQPLNPGDFGWPGCCNGGTYDDPYTGKPGAFWGVDSAEWVKPPYTHPVTGKYLPGQPWENQVSGHKSVCFGCQVSSVIVLTDGAPKYDNSVPITKMMQLLIEKGVKHGARTGLLEGTPVKFDPIDPELNPDVGGINYCDQFVKVDNTEPTPDVYFTKADCDYTDYNWPVGHGVGNKNFMDDVSFFLANMDLRDDMAGVQSMRTYTIGYGDNSAMLQSIARAGKGNFYQANDAVQLRTAILDALGDIRQLSTSFAAANISGVQASGAQASVFVPRFIPRRNRPYEGHLYRFFYYSEFAQGCDSARAKTTLGDDFDLNEDKDCDDTFFVDSDGISYVSPGVPDVKSFKKINIVQENTEGDWVKQSTATPVGDGKVEGGVKAKPFWNLGDTVGKRSAALHCDPSWRPGGAPKDDFTLGRCIFTMIDRDNNGKFDVADNPPVEFHPDNIGELQKYVMAGGDTFCSTLYAKAGLGPWDGTPAQQKTCAETLIRFVRGVDVFDYDGDSNKTEERPCADNKPGEKKSCKLADIFHSTPVTVEAPGEPFLCSLGLNGQCVSTLYEDFSNSVSSEPRCAVSGGAKPCYQRTPLAASTKGARNGAYGDFQKDMFSRPRVALVGSNGGMLHAIHVGDAVGTAADVASGKKGFGSTYTVGTGEELWAFIPPDLLPKLSLMVGAKHEYFVDGTPMVRDIWADGGLKTTAESAADKDGTKQADEFRTIAVITERGGGQRYVALDVTDPYLMLKSMEAPSDPSSKPFRWMFPNACDPQSASMGQSWSNFAPKPPPIGPVRLEATSGTDGTRGWEERWVAVLNGGYSSDLTRGRGVYMVDAWTGKMLWSAEAQPGFKASSPYNDVLNQMMPVAASPALVDIGKAETVERDLDGFFDTMVVGDMGGQAWTFRFKKPGTLDGSGRVTNWFGARSLEMQREDGSTIGPQNAHEKAPFFNIPSNVLQPDTGWLRSFMGTGDKQHLRTTAGSDCGPDDLLACIRLKCNVSAKLVAEVNGQKRSTTLKYELGVLKENKEDWVTGLGDACSSSRMELTELSISCPAASLGATTYPTPWTGAEKTFKTESFAKSTGTKWTGDHLNLNTSEHPDLKLGDAEKATVANNRYFGFHAYGGWQRKFTDEDGAVKFDKMRVSDKKSGYSCPTGVNCSLVDVTIPDSAYEYMPADASGFKQRYIPTAKILGLKRAGSEDPGWFIRYNNSLLERTAAGSTVLAGIVFWPSFSPAAGKSGSACSLTGSGDMSYSWQADAITGLPDMAEGFRTGLGYIDSKGRGTTAPPSEGAPIISLSKTGGIRFEVAVTSPGDAPKTEVLHDKSNVTPDIYWMEVPRNLHECRHENAEACVQP